MACSINKQILLIVFLLLASLFITGCGCKHESIIIFKPVEAGCTTEGYTGDTVCTICNTIISKGKPVPATGHDKGELTGVSEPSCTAAGYSGNIACTACGEILEQGTAIPMKQHAPSEVLSGVCEATCTIDGYTGDTVCTDCSTVLISGENIPMTGHTNARSLSGVSEATCISDGYTGDVICEVCGEVTLPGQVITAAGHISGDPVGASEATCTSDGYTGDVICEVCGEVTLPGQVIAAAGHISGDPVGASEPTCSAYGYTGDITCCTCGELLFAGEAIAPLNEHAYVKDECSLCGWLKPGLYFYGSLVMSWDELKLNGFVKVEDGVFKGISGAFTTFDVNAERMLLIGSDVTCIKGQPNSGVLNNPWLTSIWIPASVTDLGSYLLSTNYTVTEIRLFCPISKLADNTFADACGLNTIYLPGSLESLNKNAFSPSYAGTIVFGGTEEQWASIGGSDILPNTTIVFDQ